MKRISLFLKTIIVLFGVCLIISGMLFLANYRKASAFMLGTFEMDLGAYAKVNGGAGLRMRVKLDSTTKEEAEKEGNTLFFLLMKEEMFNAAETATPGEYDFSSYITCDDFTNDGCQLVEANKNLIYYSSKDACYYSNLLIKNIPEEYRTVNLCVVAGITDGAESTFAAFDIPSQVCKKYYEVVNAAALDGFMDKVNDIAGYTSWYGTSNYPIYVKDNTQYNDLQNSVKIKNVDLSSKFVDFGDAVTRDADFESTKLSEDNIAEELDVSFDFDLSLDSTTYSAKITEINEELTTNAINRVTFDNCKSIAFTKDAVNSELVFESETVNSFGTGEHVVRVITDEKIYKVKLTPVTKIITDWNTFKEITKKSDVDDYYILGADITADSQINAISRIWFNNDWHRDAEFKGVLDGRGFVVKDMIISDNGRNDSPSCLMNKLSGKVKNIAFINARMTSNNTYNGGSGALCNALTGTIENVYMDVALKNLNAGGSASGLFFSGNNATAKVTNCVVKATVQDGSTGSHYGFGRDSYSSSTVENSYFISGDVARYNKTFSNAEFGSCVKYDNGNDFFYGVKKLPRANGWAKYWNITSDGLNFVGAIADLDISSSFSWTKTEGIVADKTWSDYGKVKYSVKTCKRSGYIDVSAYQGKTLKIMLPYSASYGLAFYTTANQSEGRSNADGWLYNNKTSGADTTAEFSITIPETACFVRTTYYNENEKEYTGGDFYAKVVTERTVNLLKCDSEIRFYKIAIPNDSSYLDEYAAQEFAKYIKLSTDYNLNIVKENRVTLSDKLIVIGETDLATQASVSIDKGTTGDDGFIIKSVGDDIFVIGGAGTGTVYGVYELLHYLIGFEAYAPDEIYYEHLPIILNDLNYDIIVTPSFETRSIKSLSWNSKNKTEDALLMRVSANDSAGFGSLQITDDGKAIREWGLWAHSLGAFLLPWSTYQTVHPEWFEGEEGDNGDVGYQIVMSNPQVVAEVANNLKTYFNMYPNAKYFMIGINDNGIAPEADASLAASLGGYGGVYINFLNQIDEIISAWLESKGQGDRDYKLIGLGYSAYLDAPTDNAGNPIITANANVGMMVAPITADWDNAIDAVGNTYNEKNSASIENWGKVVNGNLFIWSYSTSFREYLIDFNNLSTLQSYYEFYKDNGTVFLFDQGASQTNTPFKPLRDYVQSKLAWDITEDTDELIDAFIDNYYKVAATQVKAYYKLIRDRYTTLKNNGTLTYIYCGNNAKGDLLKTEYWTYSFCQTFMSYVDSALAAIENSALSESEKATLISRVKLDSIMPRYIMLSLYGSNFRSSTTTLGYKKIIAEFEADCEAFGVKNYRETYRGENISQKINEFKEVVDYLEFNVYPDVVSGYLELTEESEIAEYLNNHRSDYQNPEYVKPVHLTWNYWLSSTFEVTISKGYDFNDVVFTATTTNKYVDVYNLVPGVYCYKVTRNGSALVNDAFEVLGDMRMIYLGNTNLNMRDEGGYTGEFGKVKYELLYRSADITEVGSKVAGILTDDLGIKTEIDLRLPTDDKLDGKTSPSESITRYNLGIRQMDYMFPGLNSNRAFSQTYADNLREIMNMLANEENYPLVYHCSAGADRTGTLSLLVGGLLGLDYDTLVKDFEVTSFYKGRRWRSAINEENGVYSFDESGVMEDDSGNIVSFDKVYRHILTRYGTVDGKFSSAVENYLTRVIGVSRDTIENIRAILIEGYEKQEEIVYSSDSYDNLYNLGGEVYYLDEYDNLYNLGLE